MRLSLLRARVPMSIRTHLSRGVRTRWIVVSSLLLTTIAMAQGPLPNAVPPPPPPPGRVVMQLGEGVVFTSPDTGNSLQLRLRGQMQAAALRPIAGGETAIGAQVRRLRVLARGQHFDGRLETYVQLGLAQSDLEARPVPLRDAMVTWRAHRYLEVRFGQQKMPYGRQRRTSSGNLQLVDRSATVAEFNLDRDVGLMLGSADLFGLDGRVGYAVGVFGGAGRNRAETAPGVLWLARVSLEPLGRFDEQVEADLKRRSTPRFAIAASGGVNDRTDRLRSTHGEFTPAGTLRYRHYGVDFHAKWRGLSLQSEWMRRDGTVAAAPTDPAVPAPTPRSGWGAYGQLGYVLPLRTSLPAVELVSRFGVVRAARDAPTALRDEREAGGGVNLYLRGHDLKVQLDAFHLRTASAPDSVRVRLQVQIWL